MKIIFLIIILIIILIIFYFILKKKSTFHEIQTLDAAVIVEPRSDPLLIPIVRDTIQKLPNNTIFYIFHGTENIDLIKNGLNNYIKSGKIVLINLNKSNITREIYSELLTSSDFWNKINGENILIFQTDSCICKYPKYNITYFLKYGYIGGPLNKSNNPNSKDYQNGGFSLRKKSAMLNAIATKKLGENTWPCDEWYSVNKQELVNLAPYNIATDFAVERVYSDAPFGIHKPWDFLSTNELTKLKKNCPEISTIFGK